MSPVLEQAITRLKECPEWEQEAIAHHILEDIEDYAEPIAPALLDELARRADTLEANPNTGLSWEQVEAQTREKLRLARLKK